MASRNCSEVLEELGLDADILGPRAMAGLHGGHEAILVKYADHRGTREASQDKKEEVAGLSPQEDLSPHELRDCHRIPAWLEQLGLNLSVGALLTIESSELQVERGAAGQHRVCLIGQGPVSKHKPEAPQKMVLETLAERHNRALALGSNSFRVQQEGSTATKAFELCTELPNHVAASVSEFRASGPDFLARVTWRGPCSPAPEDLEFSFARLVMLHAEAIPEATGLGRLYKVRVPNGLTDSFNTSQILGSIWLRLQLSPQHWL